MNRRYFPISDNRTFAKVMSNRPDLCKELIERILDVKISEIRLLETERTLTSIVQKSVRFDVFLDSPEAAFEVELQTTKEPNLGKRIRYYQSQMDRRLLLAGTSYQDLKPTYVIFICLVAPFSEHQNQPVFTFVSKSSEVPGFCLDTGVTYVVLNAAGDMGLTTPQIASVLHYLKSNQSQSGDGLTEQLDIAVREANMDEEWTMGLMTYEMEMARAKRIAEDEGREKGLAEGREKGLEEGRAEGRAEERNLINDLMDAMEAAGLSLSQIREELKSKTTEDLCEKYLSE